MSSGADVIKLIKDKKVKFVDYRFTDTKPVVAVGWLNDL